MKKIIIALLLIVSGSSYAATASSMIVTSQPQKNSTSLKRFTEKNTNRTSINTNTTTTTSSGINVSAVPSTTPTTSTVSAVKPTTSTTIDKHTFSPTKPTATTTTDMPINPASPAKLTKLTVILDWFPNPDHAPLIVAQQQGYFKEQGLDVQLIGPSDPNDPPKLVAARKADIGITYEPQYIEQIDQGLPLISFGTLIDKPLNCLVALSENGIKDISDLKGKSIGSTTGGLSGVMMDNLLQSAQISTNEVTMVNVRYNLTQALLSHKVDAVTGLNRNFEVPQIEAQGKKVVTFFPEDYGTPNYSELIFITNKFNIHDPRLPKFIAAIKKAVAYLDQHPDTAWDGFAKQYPEANNKVNHDAWFATLPYFAEEPAEFNTDEWQAFAQFMQKNLLIKKAQPISTYTATL